MIWLKNSTFGVKQQSLTHSVAPEENYRYKIFYFPIMEPSTEQNNHLQIKEHKIHIWFLIIKCTCNLKTLPTIQKKKNYKIKFWRHVQQVTNTLHSNTKCIKFEYTSSWKYSNWWLTLIVFGRCRCKSNYHTIRQCLP
jgi:hypothetical protein